MLGFCFLAAKHFQSFYGIFNLFVFTFLFNLYQFLSKELELKRVRVGLGILIEILICVFKENSINSKTTNFM